MKTAWVTRLKLPLALIVAAIMGVDSSTQWVSSASASTAEIRRILTDRVDRDHWAVGLVVGVVSPQGRRVVSYGRARAGNPRRVNGDTVFEIASVTKVFTSLVLADMALRGEVNLSDPIDKFLPPQATAPTRNNRSITLEDLATHTSGLPRQPFNLMPRDMANPYADYAASQLYDFLAGVTLTHDVGTTYEYSNVGAGLLGHLLGRAAGMDFRALVSARVLNPLGMRSTAFAVSAEMSKRAAAGHNALLQTVPAWDVAEPLAGSGGLRSTANDLLTFVSAILNRRSSRIYAAATLMIDRARSTANTNMQTGLGWKFESRLQGRTLVYHDGASGGYRSFIGFDREVGTGVVILSNTNSEADLNDLGMHLLDKRAVLLDFQPTTANDPATLDRYAGVFRLDSGAEVTVIRMGRILYAKVPERPAVMLSAEREGEFSVRQIDLTNPPTYVPTAPLPARIAYRLDSNGDPTIVILEDGTRAFRGKRVR